jgi:GNAT superfamily N-acetyltransferase
MQAMRNSMAQEGLVKTRWMIRGDCDSVARIAKNAMIHRRPISARESQIALRQKTVVGAIAEDVNGGVLGFCFLDSSDEAIASIVLLVVDHKWHRCGVGTELMNHVERICRHLGYAKFSVMVHEREFEAQKFFADRGYRCTFIHQRFDGDDAGYYFIKEIT